MTERLRVHEIDDDEKRRLVRIIHRRDGPVLPWRRAQMVLLSAQGMDLPAIAKVAFTSEDRVRDVIRNFNTDGFGSLHPNKYPVSPSWDPGWDPAAIRDVLPTAERADFGRSYAAALDEAKRTYSLEPVEEALERWRRVADSSATDPAASQQIRQDFQRWSDDYQNSIHTRLERVHASAGVWLSVLTTIVALLGSLVLLKGGSLVTEVTATGWLQALLVGLVSLVFLVAVLALLAGAVATWGGLWDFGGQAQSYSDPEWFPHITRVARWLARIPAEDRDHSMAGKPEWVTYRDRYRSNAERSRIYLHASRMLGGVAAILIGVVAIAAITVGTFAAAPTYVLVVYHGGVTCSTSTQYAKYPHGVTQVTPVDSCQLPGRKG